MKALAPCITLGRADSGSDIVVVHSPRRARALAHAEEGPFLSKAVSVEGTCSRRDRKGKINH